MTFTYKGSTGDVWIEGGDPNTMMVDQDTMSLRWRGDESEVSFTGRDIEGNMGLKLNGGEADVGTGPM
jgi:hypothetical protein